MAQTSDRVSRIGAQRLRITAAEIRELAGDDTRPSSLELLAQDIRAMAASAMRQDETKGPRKPLIKRILGR